MVGMYFVWWLIGCGLILMLRVGGGGSWRYGHWFSFLQFPCLHKKHGCWALSTILFFVGFLFWLKSVYDVLCFFCGSLHSLFIGPVMVTVWLGSFSNLCEILILMSYSFSSFIFTVSPCLSTRNLTASVGMVVTDLVTVWVEVAGLVSCFGVYFLLGFLFWLSFHVLLFFGVFVDAVGDDFSCLGCDMVAVFFEDGRGRDFISFAVAIVVGSSLLMARLNRFLSFWWLWFLKGGISSILILVCGFCLLFPWLFWLFFCSSYSVFVVSLVPIMT